MQIKCPECHQVSEVDKSQISETGHLQCLKCRVVFSIRKEGKNIGYCPKCGFKQILGIECVNCGIVFFKYATVLEREVAKNRLPAVRRLPPPKKSDIAGLNRIDQIITVTLRIAVGVFLFFFGCIPYGAVIDGGAHGLFYLLFPVGLILLCWKLPPKIIPPIRSGLESDYIKNLKERLVIIIGAITAGFMSIFPPFQYTNHGGLSYSQGYYFILSAPSHLQIDVPRLFVQWVITAIVTFVVYYFIKEIQRQKQQS